MHGYVDRDAEWQLVHQTTSSLLDGLDKALRTLPELLTNIGCTEVQQECVKFWTSDVLYPMLGGEEHYAAHLTYKQLFWLEEKLEVDYGPNWKANPVANDQYVRTFEREVKARLRGTSIVEFK